jgi:ATP-dependent DNA ligase
MTNEVICYSRNLETYTGLVDISTEIKELALPTKPSDVTVFFDGELYCHGMSLQDISGLVRAKDGRDKGELKLIIFDVFFNYSSWAQKISSERQAYLAEIFNLNTLNTQMKSSHLQLAPIYKITSMADAFKKADEFVANGYEGAVIRRDDGKYDYSYNGRHTNMAYKVKRREEHEFMIVGYEQGTRGKAADMMLWACQTAATAAAPIAKQFNVMINMTNDDNRKLFEYLNEHPAVFEKYFKHRYVNIEYAELSKDGVPLQAKATMLFRNPPITDDKVGSPADEDFYVEINDKLKSIINN